jgi:hypothetical protein
MMIRMAKIPINCFLSHPWCHVVLLQNPEQQQNANFEIRPVISLCLFMRFRRADIHFRFREFWCAWSYQRICRSILELFSSGHEWSSTLLIEKNLHWWAACVPRRFLCQINDLHDIAGAVVTIVFSFLG